MPYKSLAQQRYFHAAAARGEIPGKTVHEFDVATKGHYGKLPEHVKAAHGGEAQARHEMVCPHCGQKFVHGGEVEGEDYAEPLEEIEELEQEAEAAPNWQRTDAHVAMPTSFYEALKSRRR